MKAPSERFLPLTVAVVLAALGALLGWARWEAWAVGRGTVQGHDPSELPALERPDAGFVTSSACRACHPEQYATWHRTYHRTMTRVATRETVVAPWEGVLELHDQEVELLGRGDGLWAEMVDPEFENERRRRGLGLGGVREAPRTRERIALVTGSHHMQVFWVRRDSGALFQFPFAYLLETGRWAPVDDTLLKPPQPFRDIPTWNTTCDYCHAVAANPGIDFEARSIDTEVAELGIGCEACHGPAAEHVARHRRPVGRYLHRLGDRPDPTIVNPAELSAAAGSEVCGQCHGIALPRDGRAWITGGDPYRAGGELAASRDLIQPASRPDTPRLAAERRRDPAYLDYQFWPDGMVRVSGREHTAMVESACFAGGELACTSCHSMHDADPDDQLAAGREGDGACVQCHGAVAADVERHTHHPAASSGSRCANCHMPHTTYGLLKAIRSHWIDSPTVAATVATGRPNACNLCHVDRTLGWTQDALADWYGTSRVPLDLDQETVAAAVLALARGDAGQRALAAWSLGWEPALEAAGTGWQAPLLARTLDDPYAAVRFVAARSLRRQPGFADFEYDYVAPTALRLERRRAALEAWRSVSGAPPAAEPRVARYGDPELWARLVARRDHRPVMLLE